MKQATLEGLDRYLHFKLGKKDTMGIDLVQVISDYLKISKAKSKRLVEEGGVDMTFRVKEII